jgi:hypothetical protein
VEDINSQLEGHPSVWLIVRDIESADPDWTVKTWLDTHGYVRQKDLVSESLTVMKYYRWDKAPKNRSANRARIEPKVFLPVISHSLALQSYVIKPENSPGDCPAVRHNRSGLMDTNQLENPLKISEGQELMIP